MHGHMNVKKMLEILAGAVNEMQQAECPYSSVRRWML
jgi:hemerythrin-like domain-containing protein